jgi:hypothetical protein
MRERESRCSRRLIAVVAAAGVITGLSGRYVMAAQVTSAATTPLARDGALTGAHEESLYGVACLSAKDCLAVGADVTGPHLAETWTPVAQTWNGTRWRAVSVKLPSGASGARLEGVACPSAAGGMHCMVVGAVFYRSKEEALAETWNGKAWTPVPPQAADELSAVSCLSPKRCVAVGLAGPSSGGIGSLLAESWNGSTWTRGKISAPTHTHGGFLDGVSCTTASFCVATGAVFAGSNETETPLIEGWNGTHWAVMKPPAPKSNTGLYAVSCPSAKSCVTVGSGYTQTGRSTSYAETRNGTTWALTSAVPWPRGTNDPRLYGVSCPAAGQCVTVGFNDWPPTNDTLTGHALAATWNGKAWTATTVGVPGKHDASAFAGVTCLPGKTAFCAAVGYRGPQFSAQSSPLSGFWNGTRWKVILFAQ